MGRYESRATVRSILGPLLHSYWGEVAPARGVTNFASFSDDRFYLPEQAELDQVLDGAGGELRIANAPELGEGFDCDDFTYALKGFACRFGRDQMSVTASICLGIAWGHFEWIGREFHATNWVLRDDHQLFWIEPQGTPQNRRPQIYAANRCRGGLRLLLV